MKPTSNANMSYVEIGNALGISHFTVREIEQRALRKLTRKLAPYLDEFANPALCAGSVSTHESKRRTLHSGDRK